VVDDDGVQPLLAAEVLVDAGLRDLGALGDLLDRRRLVAALREHLAADLDELRAAHLAIIAALGAYVVVAAPPWYLALLAAIVAGHSWGCLGFLAHEALHHGLTRNRTLERVAGTLGFAIMCLSPTLWMAWHNQAHHGNTGRPVADPDGFGRLGFWRKNAVVRALERPSPGSGLKRSAVFLPMWFSLHSLLVLVFHGERNRYYAHISRRSVYLESGSMLPLWLGVLALVGPWSFLFVYGVPLLVANTLVMSYIATNHFLNPLTETNDPLANTRSVTSPRHAPEAPRRIRYARRSADDGHVPGTRPRGSLDGCRRRAMSARDGSSKGASVDNLGPRRANRRRGGRE
jgi:hypothetical protein